MTSAFLILGIIAALAMLGLALVLVPAMVGSGIWAHNSAKDNRAQAKEIEQLLKDVDR